MNFESINIFGLRIDKTGYSDLLAYVENSIGTSSHSIVAYANANTLNLAYNDNGLRECINSFGVVHPDGIGTYMASRSLYWNNGLHSRFTGSDFYQLLAAKAIEKNWSVYFFGHDSNTLQKIKLNLPHLNIAGISAGFNYTDDEVDRNISKANPQLLIIGLPSPAQETWLCRNKDRIPFGCAILTGDGIKIFAGTKIRGPKIIRNLGFEWLVRMISNPILYWKRYFFGIPLFLYRIFNKKMAILRKNR